MIRVVNVADRPVVVEEDLNPLDVVEVVVLDVETDVLHGPCIPNRT